MIQTRRHFITLAAASVAAVTLPRALSAATEPVRRTLGYNLYSMKTVPLAEAVATCAKIGYRNVEVCMLPGYPAEPAVLSKAARAELRRQLDGLGLTVSSIMPYLRLNGDNAVQASNLETLRLAAELGQDLCPGSPPPVRTGIGDGTPAQWDELKARMVARLGEWADTLKSAHAVGAIGGHAGNAVNTPSRLLWLHQQVARPEIALYYDHVNYSLEGVPFEQSIPALIPYCRFVHIQDATGTGGNKTYLLAGDPAGPTNYTRYFRALANADYRGPLVVHVSGKFSAAPRYDPISVAKLCFERMDAALRSADQT
jgi:sugar phosphate isomerase/epimerase